MRALHVVFGGGCVVAGVLVAIALSLEQDSGAPALAAAREPDPVDRLRALQRDVDALKQSVQRPRIVVAPARDAPPEGSAGETHASEARPPEPISPVEIPEMLEVHHAREAVDRAWTDKLRTELDAALGTGHTSTVAAVLCAASLCKISFVHETAGAQRELASTIASLAGFSAGVFYRYEEGAEPPRTVLYVVREGHDIRDLLAAQ